MKNSFAKRWLSVLLVLAMCLSLAPAVFAADTLDGYTISITGDSEVEVDKTTTLTAEVMKDSVKVDPADVKWSSSAPDTAAVDPDSGVVTAKAAGHVTISAAYTLPDASAQAGNIITADHEIEVKPASPAAPTISLDRNSLSLKEKETGTLTAAVDNGSASTNVVWTTNDPNIVSVVGKDSRTATITANKAGTATVTATYGTGGSAVSASCTVTVTAAPAEPLTIKKVAPNTDQIVIEKGSTGGRDITVAPTPANAEVKWKFSYTDDEGNKQESTSSDIVSLNGTGNTVRVIGQKPGKVDVIAYVGEGTGVDQSVKVEVQVSGIVVDTTLIEVMENERKDLPVPKLYGSAASGGYEYESNDSFIATVINSKIVGYKIGETQVIVKAQKGNYKENIPIKVIADPTTTIEAGTIGVSDTLDFDSSFMRGKFEEQLGGRVVSVTGLKVSSTDCGTLYYNYRAEAEPGPGVGGIETYYRDGHVPAGQKALSDITFVPKASFIGGDVEITYTATTMDKETYACKIVFTIKADNGPSAGIALTTPYNTAVRFSSAEFSRVCREKIGTNLDYVMFSLPPTREGTLYTDYAGEGNFGSLVTMRSQYSRKDLDDVWFVPAPGFEGDTVVYYTGRGVGATGASYSGQIKITVGPEGGVDIGGLAYDTVRGGVAHFDDADFNDYCQDLLSNSKTLSYLQFDSLPSSDQGTLYYDYRSSSSTGTRASTGTSYYYGTRTPRIDRLTFAPAEDFTGTIKLPFTAWATDGTRFTGNVEINVRGGSGYGDIHYTCKPGQRKNFNDSDFNSLCKEVTNDRLNYIVFQGLPDRNREGSLYLNNSRITSTGTSYYYGTSSREIDDLSFRAVNNFSGAVDIPFVGHAVSGETFNGVLTIESSGSSSSGRWEISYTATTKDPAVFKRADFNDLCQWETDRDISSIRFNDIPSRSEGDLYRNYYSTSSKGSRITSTSTSISSSEINRVAFIPASGFTGTVTLGFTAKATNGDTFDGTLEITVERPGADVTVRYSTRVAPVDFRGEDFRRSGSTLSSIRFSSLPPASAGYLYYQYTSPTRYGRQASTGTNYRLNGSDLISDLTFIPRAGFTGTVTLPYTGTNSNNSTFEGEVVITVSPTYSSSHFSDLGSYSDQQRAAVDYLYDNDITKGISSTQYGPEYSITRGDFAVMVYKAFGLSPMGSGRFNDVPSSAYYAQAVNTLSALGIVSGIGGGAYGPDYTLTREDAICMVQRAMRSVGWSANDGSSSSLLAYSDGNSVSGYARGAMANAVQMGYLPTNGGRLDPAQPLTRIDMAQIIHRVLTY